MQEVFSCRGIILCFSDAVWTIGTLYICPNRLVENLKNGKELVHFKRKHFFLVYIHMFESIKKML